jgi:hypothetical protein
MESQSTSAVSLSKGRTGMLGFTIVWAGQMLSLLGTNMTGFGLAIWIYEVTAEFPSHSILVGCLLRFCASDSDKSFSGGYS